MHWLALDIGGANLKAADGQGYAASQSFPLWEKPRQLAEALRGLISNAPPCDHLAATMTGELADCYPTKAEGVRQILASLAEAADGRHTRVYLCDGRLVSPQVARGQPVSAAASNWHALARFAGRYCKGENGLLIDVGSTTTDIIPLADGSPAARGKTDPERLVSGELVYTGVQRSPVCALVGALPWRGQSCPTAQELFATTQDAYLLLGDVPEDPTDLHTADRRPATRGHAIGRLARAICADADVFDQADARAAAETIQEAQLSLLARAAAAVVARMPAPPRAAVISGRGEFLARRLLARLDLPLRIVSLSEELGERVSRCATAHALAVLAREAR